MGLQEVVNIISDAMTADSVLVYLLDVSGDWLHLKASNTGQKTISQVSLKVGEGITGWTAEKNEIVVLKKKAYEDRRFKSFSELPEDHFEAFLSIPIIYKNNLIGVMNIQHKEPHTYPKRLVEFVTTITRNMAGLIENARLYEESRNKLRRFECLLQISQSVMAEGYLEDILKNIVSVTASLIDSKICSIMLANEKKNTLEIKASESLSDSYHENPPLDIDNSVSGDVLKTQQSMSVYDVKKEPRFAADSLAEKENLTSLLLVPMIIKNKAIGVLNVYTQNHHVFTQDEKDTLQIIANQAAMTIDNRLLMEDNMRTKEALETRKLVERAKGIIMKQHQIDEQMAHRMLHKRSMDSCRSMKDIAEAIILTEDIKSK